jgi:hypothetical protein
VWLSVAVLDEVVVSLVKVAAKATAAHSETAMVKISNTRLPRPAPGSPRSSRTSRICGSRKTSQA